MTAVAKSTNYERQQSTDSGWDNPFRPGGDLSREADEIVNMIRGGIPVTPTNDYSSNINAQIDGNFDPSASEEAPKKQHITQTDSAQNGSNSSHKVVLTETSSSRVCKQVVPAPTSASHVVVDEKKNKKKGCCSVQ